MIVPALLMAFERARMLVIPRSKIGASIGRFWIGWSTRFPVMCNATSLGIMMHSGKSTSNLLALETVSSQEFPSSPLRKLTFTSPISMLEMYRNRFATPPVTQMWSQVPPRSIFSATVTESSTLIPPNTAIHGLFGFSKA